MASEFLSLASFISIFIFIFVGIPLAAGNNFSFTSFSPTDPNIEVSNGTTVSDGALKLTDVLNSTGRAQYTQPIQLWDPHTNSTTNFTTYFEFTIQIVNSSSNSSSGGFTFFMAPTIDFDGVSSNNVLAVEFDPSDNHSGVNVNSTVSKANETLNNNMTSGDTLAASVSYIETSQTLRVQVQDPRATSDVAPLNLADQLDLRKTLPEKVIVGFSASSGSSVIMQKITKWNFTSSLDLAGTEGRGGGGSMMWVLGPVIPLSVLVVGAVSIWFFRRINLGRKRRKAKKEEKKLDKSMDDDFARGTGPRRFTYKELATATSNFSEKGKLGEGGFGGVYRGFLTDLNIEVAVKKISRSSKQGRKEYASEVRIISRLRHRNLVQLIGWCHERGEFLLVYEFMTNGSLDTHLFGKKTSLTWELRYKIAHGLASVLLYLQEEWEQCVVHRDIKSSNVMLDSDFNAKLGDFGLARLADHKRGLQTTALAGTLGYLAPECFITGKASKESDVFSLGVVALEIATGRRAVDHDREEDEVRLVDWVWRLNGRGRIADAADWSLKHDFDAKQMETLMQVGLWCAHPDHSQRPSMRQVIQALNFEGQIPQLPDEMPVPVYAAPALPVRHSVPSMTNSSLICGR